MKKTFAIKSSEKALSDAAALCSKKECCEADILQKLLDWNLSLEDASQIIEKLKEEKFLDENRFALFYAKDKLKFNHWGKIKIKHFLKQKKVKESIIQNSLNQIDDELYFEILDKLIASKVKNASMLKDIKFKARLYNNLASHGFESECIKERINILKQAQNDTE